MNKIVSDDSLSRAEAWLSSQFDHVLAPLLGTLWILDIDTTIMPLYGKQEGAALGYNPHKPGRPSHANYSYLMSGLRLVLNVAVTAGNR